MREPGKDGKPTPTTLRLIISISAMPGVEFRISSKLVPIYCRWYGIGVGIKEYNSPYSRATAATTTRRIEQKPILLLIAAIIFLPFNLYVHLFYLLLIAISTVRPPQKADSAVSGSLSPPRFAPVSDTMTPPLLRHPPGFPTKRHWTIRTLGFRWKPWSRFGRRPTRFPRIHTWLFMLLKRPSMGSTRLSITWPERLPPLGKLCSESAHTSHWLMTGSSWSVLRERRNALSG